MERFATMIVAVGFGLHCGASPAAAEADDELGWVSHGGESAGDQGGDGDARGADGAEPLRDLGARPAIVTSRVEGDDGATYAAGTFSGRVSVGDTVLESRGEDDVFVARFARGGKLSWAHGVGSTTSEAGPRVTFADGRVTLVATTRGEVDCGSGPLGSWSGRMFFLCVFDARGATLAAGSFPTDP